MSDPPLLTGETFDAIIIGTGLPESILSAALSLSGAKVLHLDPSSSYGAHHSTISLSNLQSLARDASAAPPPRAAAAAPAESFSACFGKDAKRHPAMLRGRYRQCFPRGVRMACADEEEVAAVASRVFVDLAPRTVLGGGVLVDLLVQTGVGHYLSFRPLDASYLFFEQPAASQRTNRKHPEAAATEKGPSEGCLRKVPASRADVFQNKFLSMVEKRLLMRFLKNISPDGLGAVVEGTEGAANVRGMEHGRKELFEDLMEEARLTENLRAFVRHTISFSEDISHQRDIFREGNRVTPDDAPLSVSSADGCAAVEAYLKSLARYGTPTPFLYPNYGSGEYCEAFCRLSAVHGGTFMLRKEIDAFVTGCGSGDGTGSSEAAPSGKLGVITADGDQLLTSNLFVSSSLLEVLDTNKLKVNNGVADSTAERTTDGNIWRYVGLLDEPCFPEEVPRAVAIFPKGCRGNTGATVRVVEMNSTAEVCPDGKFLIYAETLGSRGSQRDITSVMANLVQDDSFEADMTEDKGLLFDDEVVSASNESSNRRGPRLRPKTLWSMTYARGTAATGSCSELAEQQKMAFSLVAVRDVLVAMDASAVLGEARRCFQIARPEAEFFPVPDEPDSGSSGTGKNSASEASEEDEVEDGKGKGNGNGNGNGNGKGNGKVSDGPSLGSS